MASTSTVHVLPWSSVYLVLYISIITPRCSSTSQQLLLLVSQLQSTSQVLVAGLRMQLEACAYGVAFAIECSSHDLESLAARRPERACEFEDEQSRVLIVLPAGSNGPW